MVLRGASNSGSTQFVNLSTYFVSSSSTNLDTYALQVSCRELLLAGKLHNNSGELRKGPDLFGVLQLGYLRLTSVLP